jgi:hypothetical protein
MAKFPRSIFGRNPPERSRFTVGAHTAIDFADSSTRALGLPCPKWMFADACRPNFSKSPVLFVNARYVQKQLWRSRMRYIFENRSGAAIARIFDSRAVPI